MKYVTLLLLLSLATGCSNDSTATSYCDATTSHRPTLKLAVHDVYVYGTLEHGSMLIAPSCVRPLYSFYSLQDAASSREGAAERIQAFNIAVFNAPAKAGGMFKLHGVVNVYPETMQVELHDVSEFHEVDDTEAKSIIQLVRRSRN